MDCPKCKRHTLNDGLCVDCAAGLCSPAPAGSGGFRLTTLPHIDGKITQELQEYTGDVTRTLTRWVMDSREKGVHDSLVQLGWTPPNNDLSGRR